MVDVKVGVGVDGTVNVEVRDVDDHGISRICGMGVGDVAIY